MTIRNKRKMAALNRENCEENPRINVAQNSGAPRSQEDYITQISEEIEGRVHEKAVKGVQSNRGPHSWCPRATR